MFAVEQVTQPINRVSHSRRLLFGYEGKLNLLDTESGSVRELMSVFPGGFMGIAVSGDDRWIYFGREENEADIWLLTLNEEQK